MKNIPEEKAFYLKDGKIIASLEELYNTLAELEQSTFSYHVNSAKNDFYLWIKDVLKLENLANKLKDEKEKQRFIDLIKEELERQELERKKPNNKTVPRKKSPRQKISKNKETKSTTLAERLDMEIKKDIQDIKETEEQEFEKLHIEHENIDKKGFEIKELLKNNTPIIIRSLYFLMGLISGIILMFLYLRFLF
jgi:hypothetical protein